MAFDTSQIPSDLIDNFKRNLGAFFVGAGLSVDAGYPTWSGLLKELIERAEKTSYVHKDKIQEYKAMVSDDSKFLFLAEDLRVELGSAFTKFMEERFVNSNLKPTKNHELLAQIQSSLTLTVNYDDLIEKAYNKIYSDYPNSFTYTQSREAANNFWKGRFFILKAHGDAKRDIESIILSQKDYRKTLYREHGYRSLLQSIFTTKSILFLGVSMTDPEFNQLLDYLHDSYHGGGPTHYLLIDESKINATISRRYADHFNIHTVAYKNPNKDHKQIEEFLKYLAEVAPAPKPLS